MDEDVIVIHAAAVRNEYENEGEKREKILEETELVYDIQLIFFSPKCLPAGSRPSTNIMMLLLLSQPAMNVGHYNHVYSHCYGYWPFFVVETSASKWKDPPSSTYSTCKYCFPPSSFVVPPHFSDFEILISAHPDTLFRKFFFYLYVSATFEFKRSHRITYTCLDGWAQCIAMKMNIKTFDCWKSSVSVCRNGL